MYKLLSIIARLTIVLFGVSILFVQPRSWYCANPTGVVDIAYSPDSTLVAVVGVNGVVDLWSLNSNYPTNLFQNIDAGDKVQLVVYAPNGKSLLTGGVDKSGYIGIARTWNLQTGKLEHTLTGHKYQITALTYTSDSQSVLTSGYDGTARLWEAASGKLLHIFDGNSGGVIAASFAPNSKIFFTAGLDHTIHIWDTDSGQTLHTISTNSDIIVATFRPDGKAIVVGNSDGSVQMWDVLTGTLLQTLIGHTKAITSLQYAPDGKTFMTTSSDNTARIWIANTGILLHVLNGHTNIVRDAVYTKDSKQVLTVSEDKTLKLWDVQTGFLISTLLESDIPINKVSLAPDGKTFVIGTYDSLTQRGAAMLWDASTYKIIRPLCPIILDPIWSLIGLCLVFGVSLLQLKNGR